MIDNIQIRTTFTNQEFEKLANKLSISAQINSDKIRFDYANLRLVYYPNINKLTSTNSLHKFYNLEFGSLQTATNHNDFSIVDFYTVVHYLGEYIFEKDFDELFISSRFEFGLNIDIDLVNPFNLINKYQSCVNTHANDFFTVPPNRGKPIQRNCHFSDWYIKGYDKGILSNMFNANILRLEIVVNELRKLRNILGVTEVNISEIIKPASWYKMFNFLISTYDSIRKIPEINSLNLSIDDINAIYSYCNKLKRNDIKQSTTKYYFEQLNKGFRIIYNKYNNSPQNYHNVVRLKMFETFDRLMGKESGELQYV
jgi:hypothetical protein